MTSSCRADATTAPTTHHRSRTSRGASCRIVTTYHNPAAAAKSANVGDSSHEAAPKWGASGRPPAAKIPPPVFDPLSPTLDDLARIQTLQHTGQRQNSTQTRTDAMLRRSEPASEAYYFHKSAKCECRGDTAPCHAFGSHLQGSKPQKVISTKS